jgi:hypothetical protein
MLEITCILLRTLFFPFVFFFLFFYFFPLVQLRPPPFLRTWICHMSMFYSVIFIHVVRILYRVLGAQQSYSSNAPLLSVLLCVYALDKRKNREISPREVDTLDRSEGLDIFG